MNDATARFRVRIYIGLTVVLAVAFFLLRGSDWEGSTQLHTLMEVVATLLATLVGILALVRYYSHKDNMFLFIGAGFLGTGFLDGYHTVVTSQWFAKSFPSPAPSLIPWSWNASRTFLAILMCMSWWAWRREQRLGDRGRISELMVYLGVTAMTLAFFAFFAFVPLPRAYYPELAFGRPEEFIAALLFLAALVGYLKKGAWRDTSFEHWLVLSLIVGFMGQAMFMSSSFKLFDTMFDIAHTLKKVSYICVLTGLLIAMFDLFIQADRSTRELTHAADAMKVEVTARRESEEQLKQLTGSLEQQVTERTSDLESSREAALNMMEDAELAKREAEQAAEQLEKQAADLAEARTAALNMMEDANVARQLAEQAKQRLDAQAKELERSNKELEQFAYVASHDLQEPMRKIQAFGDMLTRQYADSLGEQGADYLDRMRNAADRMRTLISDLLTFSRVATKARPFEPVDLNEITAGVLSDLEVRIEETGAQVSVEDLPTIDADPLQMRQVMQNLIGNALKYRREEIAPEVHVHWTEQNGSCRIRIRDNGIGFDEKYVDRIFAPFQRLHGRTEYEGTGIGLAVVNKIIHRHGGTITAESVPGEGSTFVVTLPLRQSNTEESA